MLRLNIKYLLNLRGNKKQYSYLRDKGFSNHKIRLFFNQESSSVKIRDIEKLCLMFKCTPNALFDWEPNWGQKLADDHPLHSLTKQQSINLADLTVDMSPEELKEFSEKVMNLKKEVSK